MTLIEIALIKSDTLYATTTPYLSKTHGWFLVYFFSVFWILCICSITDTIIPTVEPQSPPSCILTTEEITREAATPEMMTTIEITTTREPSTVPPTIQGGI